MCSSSLYNKNTQSARTMLGCVALTCVAETWRKVCGNDFSYHEKEAYNLDFLIFLEEIVIADTFSFQ